MLKQPASNAIAGGKISGSFFANNQKTAIAKNISGSKPIQVFVWKKGLNKPEWLLHVIQYLQLNFRPTHYKHLSKGCLPINSFQCLQLYI